MTSKTIKVSTRDVKTNVELDIPQNLEEAIELIKTEKVFELMLAQWLTQGSNAIRADFRSRLEAYSAQNGGSEEEFIPPTPEALTNINNLITEKFDGWNPTVTHRRQSKEDAAKAWMSQFNSVEEMLEAAQTLGVSIS